VQGLLAVYQAACKKGEVQPGKMFVFETGHLTPPRYIINFPTKRHWRGKSRLEDIESGLQALVREVGERSIASIALPPLASGLGGRESLRLRYVQAPYGPYAENLRHVLREVEGYYLSGYAGVGDNPNQELELVPGAVSDAEKFLEGHAETRRRFERVAELVEGFETPFGLELLSTVHWVATQSGVRTPSEVVRRTYHWGKRKRQFSEEQILLALNHLSTKDWIAARHD